MSPRKQAHVRLSVFKGREAKLNKAILQTLAHKGLQTIYDLYKNVRTSRGLKYTRYASVNKRVKALQASGYINISGGKRTKAGFEVAMYELTTKAYLAMLLATASLEDLITQLDESTTATLLTSFLQNY